MRPPSLHRWRGAAARAVAAVGPSSFRRARRGRASFCSSTVQAPADSFDVVICGGGAVGSSIAYHAATLLPPGTRIAVVEQDPRYEYASTPLSAGGIRQQFSLPENIKMSIYGAEFVEAAPQLLGVEGEDPPNLQFKERGYLFLASEKGKATLRANHRTQLEAGADWIDLLSPSQLQAEFPWLALGGEEEGAGGSLGGDGDGEGRAATERVVLGALGRRNEGYLDPWSLLQALKRKAQSLGVAYIKARATGLQLSGRRVLSVDIAEADGGGSGGRRRRLAAGALVNAAGAFSAALLAPPATSTTTATSLFPLPVRARKRLVFSVHCPNPAAPPAARCPLVIDPSGVYFRSEGGGEGHFICGVSPAGGEDDPDHASPASLAVGERDHALFEERIWPALYRRVPAFEQLKVTGAWAGFYDYNTLDQNAIVGLHPETDNLLLATGFSGHGLQQAPAVGRAIAELLLTGGNGYQTLDLSRLGLRRVMEGRPLLEANIV